MKKIVLMGAMVLTGLMAFAAAPSCTIEKEFWGHSYLKLIDINGVEYKLTIPATGTTTRFKTKTGWYLIDSSGNILQYQDKHVLQQTRKSFTPAK